MVVGVRYVSPFSCSVRNPWGDHLLRPFHALVKHMEMKILLFFLVSCLGSYSIWSSKAFWTKCYRCNK